MKTPQHSTDTDYIQRMTAPMQQAGAEECYPLSCAQRTMKTLRHTIHGLSDQHRATLKDDHVKAVNLNQHLKTTHRHLHAVYTASMRYIHHVKRYEKQLARYHWVLSKKCALEESVPKKSLSNVIHIDEALAQFHWALMREQDRIETEGEYLLSMTEAAA